MLTSAIAPPSQGASAVRRRRTAGTVPAAVARPRCCRVVCRSRHLRRSCQQVQADAAVSLTCRALRVRPHHAPLCRRPSMRSLTSSIAMLLILSPLSRHAAAQETPTEREAARAVVQKMDSVERILNVPALVARLTAPNVPRDAVAARAKELMAAELLALGDDITRHPEVGFVEPRSVQLLTEYLKKHDFDVQLGAGGLKTAFVAKYMKSSGAPNLGVIVEYDALRGTKGAFHGDQHSTQGPIGIAAAVAIA